MQLIRFILIIVFLITCFLLQSAYAQGALFYKEVNLIGGYSDRDRWVDKSSVMASSVGFEYYRKFSGDYGDYLTVDIQARLAYDSKKNTTDAWGLEIHNAWLEYKLLPAAKLKLGHFVPAFGLETVVDTHATLLQTLAEKDIGFKKDWGAQLRGSFPKFDYQAALQLGSGMSIRREDGNFLATARIGSPTGVNLQYGLSFLYGEVLKTEGMMTLPKNKLLSDEAVTKKMIGLDCQYLYGPYLFKAEAAFGENDDNEVLGYLAEIDYTLPRYQNWEFQLQFQSWINDLGEGASDDSTLVLGTAYKLSQNSTLRAAYSHDFNITGMKEEDKILLQFYYFGF